MSLHQLDARRLMCPLPVIRTQKLVETLSPGDRVEVTATDRGALNDIPAWCRINGHKVVRTDTQGAEVVIEIEVGEEA